MRDLVEAGDVQSAISEMEAALLVEDQVDCPVTNHFGPGIYIREVFIPAGTFAIGHHHKKPCMNILLKGSMKIVDPSGSPRVIEAPYVFTTGPGRKAAIAIDDCVFQNIWATEETDLDALEDMLIEKSEAWIDHHEITALTKGDS
jgi:hypothetical protein